MATAPLRSGVAETSASRRVPGLSDETVGRLFSGRALPHGVGFIRRR